MISKRYFGMTRHARKRRNQRAPAAGIGHAFEIPVRLGLRHIFGRTKHAKTRKQRKGACRRAMKVNRKARRNVPHPPRSGNHETPDKFFVTATAGFIVNRNHIVTVIDFDNEILAGLIVYTAMGVWPD